MSETWEKLGLFYMGRHFDIEAGEAGTEPTLYDARDLTTHAVCVGMTGSGKTGLCIGLLEEAVLDGVPAIAIDLKGDIANLMLTFPDLAPADFRPWILEEDARRNDMSADDYAAKQADTWKKGLESWGQTPDRIRRLKEAADFCVYTPGSTAGIPLSILQSFHAPSVEVREDTELFAEQISTTVSSVLGLIGVNADPVRSREHILLSTLLHNAWAEGQNVDLPMLIGLVQNPGFEKVGVLDLNAFYPQKERFGLAMQLNNLVASPTFASWLEGEPLDIDKMLYTPEGKPRVSIVSIAHLSPEERMFFLSLLLNQQLGWMRRQSGTTNLRALLYIDEIFGYLPPVANPPSKKPLLTLLKQGRAFGLGLVLATQNPVDIDYKALSNCGTWFIGRLQTERDKARLLEALEGASTTAGSGFDNASIDRILSNLGKRVFLLHNVHEPAPVVFQTRWVMSYLRGPMTRTEIKRVMDPYKAARAASMLTIESAIVGPGAVDVAITAPVAAQTAVPALAAPAPAPAAPVTPEGYLTIAPALPTAAMQVFAPQTSRVPEGAHLAYRACLFGDATVHFLHKKTGAMVQRDVRRIATFVDGPVPVDWANAVPSSLSLEATCTDAEPGAWFVEPPEVATRKTSYTQWKRGFSDTMYRSERVSLLKSPSLDEWSTPGESERDFRIRMQAVAHAKRTELADALRARYESKLRRAAEKVDGAERRIDRESSEASRATTEAIFSTGAGILSAIFGGRSRSVSATMRRAGRAQDQRADVKEAEAKLEDAVAAERALRAELDAELASAEASVNPATESLEPHPVAPRKSDIDVVGVALLWIPVAVHPNGQLSLLATVAG